MQPFLIGVAGPFGAGKSELARLIATRLGSSVIISVDSYYLPLSHLSFEERAQCNFDHPDALDWPLIRSDLRRLHRGEPVDEPVYLFDRHSRAGYSRCVEPAKFIVVEGLFALYDQQVRALLDASIFVTAPDDICLARRMARDTAERGRSRDSVLAQYEATVRPMAEIHVLPTQVHAGLIVSGTNPLEDSWAKCRQLFGMADRLLPQ